MDRDLSRHILQELGPAESLPSIPRVVARALEMIESSNVDMEALTAVMGQDPSIASALLKAANSAALGGGAGPVDSIRDATMRLGLNEVKGILALHGAVNAFSEVPGLDLHQFWRHSTATAVAAGEMARLSPVLSRSLAGSPGIGGPYYLAGLFHDIGVLLCAVTLGDRYLEVLRKNEAALEPLWVTEEAILGFHHGMAGAALLSDWGLPELVYSAAEWHHVAAAAPEEHANLARIVHLADWITHHFGIGDAKDGSVDRFSDDAWRKLGLELHQFGVILAATQESAKIGDGLLQWVSR